MVCTRISFAIRFRGHSASSRIELRAIACDRPCSFRLLGESAFKATDSVTRQLLAESADKRLGRNCMSSAAQVQWGDAEAAMDYWAQRIAVFGASQSSI